MRPCRHSSPNTARTWSGTRTRPCFRFTNAPGRVRPHRRPPAAAATTSPPAPSTRAAAPGPARAVLEEQVERVGEVHHRDRASSLHRGRVPGGGGVAARPVREVRQPPLPPLLVGRHHVAAADRRPRRPGTPLPRPGSRLQPPPVSACTRRRSPERTASHAAPPLRSNLPESARRRSSTRLSASLTIPINFCLPWWTHAVLVVGRVRPERAALQPAAGKEVARLSSCVTLMPAPRAARNAPPPPRRARRRGQTACKPPTARAWTLAPRLFADGGAPSTNRSSAMAAGRRAASSTQRCVACSEGSSPENSRTSHSTPSGGSASTSVGSISLSQSQYLRAESMSTCSDASSPKPK